MQSYPGSKQNKGSLSKPPARGKEAPEAMPESEELKGEFQLFKESVLASAERPNAFWAAQRARIAAKLQSPVSAPSYRPALLWISAAMVVLLSLTLFVENSKAPTPDFAAGSDQELLVEVERALNQNYPEALAAAALIAPELNEAGTNAGHSVEDR